MKILLETPILSANGDLRPENEIEQAFMNIVAIDSSRKVLPEFASFESGAKGSLQELIAENCG